MTTYRDELTKEFGHVIGSVVGCGLDRLGRDVSGHEKFSAIQFFEDYEKRLDEFPIGARRQAVQEYIQSGGTVPSYIQR